MAAEAEKEGVQQSERGIEHPALAQSGSGSAGDDPEESVSWSTLMAVFVRPGRR